MAGIAAVLRGHQRVGLDTSVFIYHIEGTTKYAESAGAALDQIARGILQGVTSILTLMEMAVKPLQEGRPDVADQYDILLASYPNLTLAQLDRATARRAAELRATHRLRPADALQVAACLCQGATAFLTNDSALRRVIELEVVLLQDYVDP